MKSVLFLGKNLLTSDTIFVEGILGDKLILFLVDEMAKLLQNLGMLLFLFG
jgi:hypothetical protein